MLVCTRQAGGKARVIERRGAGIPLRIDENELTTVGGGLAIPEPARFLNPMWIHIGNVQHMPQISWQELLRAFIVLLLSLCREPRHNERREQRERENPRPKLTNCLPLGTEPAGC